MPDFIFRGASGGSAPGAYPMLRDASGALAGTVEPGDVLEFDQAPDADWELCEPPADTQSGSRTKRGKTAAGEPDPPPPGGAQDDTAGTGQEEG